MEQLGHAVENEEHTLEAKQRGNVDRVRTNDPEIHVRRVGVATRALELEAGAQCLGPRQCGRGNQQQENELTACFHSTGGSIPRPAAAAPASNPTARPTLDDGPWDPI